VHIYVINCQRRVQSKTIQAHTIDIDRALGLKERRVGKL